MNKEASSTVRLGYLRLTDSAPCLVAQELGLFAAAGLNVTLKQEVSWANLRDKLTVGELEAASLLTPLPAMVRLGVSGLRSPLLTGLILSANGNAITIGTPLAKQLSGEGPVDSAAAVAAQLQRYRRARPDRPLTFATVHHFSTHMVLLRRWLKAGGIDPDNDVRTLIIPPSQMVDSLRAGLIDGFCAGEPWNSLAVHEQVGTIAAYGQEIWPDAPEKALCVDHRWHEAQADTHRQLRQAVLNACRWLDDPAHHDDAAELLARHSYLDLPIEVLKPALCGPPLPNAGNRLPLSAREDRGLYQFASSDRVDPWHQSARELVRDCAELLGTTPPPDALNSILDATYRRDLEQELATH